MGLQALTVIEPAHLHHPNQIVSDHLLVSLHLYLLIEKVPLNLPLR